ncbi:MAG: peptide deformylase [Clostridia bacterium]
MAVYTIVKIGDEVLKQVAKPVEKIDERIFRLLDNLTDTMYEADGVGLAAPQIGISKRVAVVDTGEELIELINPEIIAMSGKSTESEGCLSVPGIYGKVERAAEVTITTLTRTGEVCEINATGLVAIALQHEIDHLEGILFLDKAISLDE